MANESEDIYQTSAYTYDLPEELIAQHPLPERSASRMMVLDRSAGTVEHHSFHELPDLIPADAMMVLNNTRVLPVRLRFDRPTGGASEIFLLRHEGEGRWRALARPAKKLRPGDRHSCGDLQIEILEDLDAGQKRVQLRAETCTIEEALQRSGEIPLPPYIRRDGPEPADRERYQTVYAHETGSSAAPTAGLHFTAEILSAVKKRGAAIEEVTLHVGAATFLPVREDDIRKHTMHSEWFALPADLARRVAARQQPVLAVGTTSLRTLETAVARQIPASGILSGETDLFIYPGYEFKAVDMLLSNFHLPGSTLLMLVSAFAGLEFTRQAYAEAVREKYRFYSYG
ncbi:tRNA preQ1(34) S-adenosylmethionine ribosyltransferase-isomerase QueA, partial [Planctomycetota bacterium]